jgi:hypothetical protein
MFTPRHALALALVSLCACDDQPAQQQATTGAAKGPSSVDIVEAPMGDEAASDIIKRELKRAEQEDRTLLVYVGAAWCEPCTRFHNAAKAGQLDARFPTLRLLEFDRDQDEKRLGAAGCLTRVIPLFAAPTQEGRCSEDKRMMGSIKGPGAVGNIAPRLNELLAKP